MKNHKAMTLAYKDLMGYSVESLPEVKMNDSHCSLLIHHASHLVTEGSWAGQASFPFHSSMLNNPSHFFALNVFGEGFQDHLLKHPPSDQGECGQPAVHFSCH